MSSITLNDMNSIPSLAIDASGNTYIAHYTNDIVSLPSGNLDIFVIKMDPSGNTIWAAQQSTQYDLGAKDPPQVVVNDNFEIFVTYTTFGLISGSTNTGNSEIVTLKLSAVDGSLIWQKINNVTDFSSDYSIFSTVADNNKFYITYYADGVFSGGISAGQTDIVVICMDMSGNVLWGSQYPVMNTPNIDMSPSIALDTSGKIFVAYQTYGVVSGMISAGLSDIVVFKLDSIDGSLLWNNQRPSFNTTSYDYSPSIACDQYGYIYVSYYSTGTASGGTSAGSFDIIIFKMDPTTGSCLWVSQQPVYNTSSGDVCPAITIDKTTGFVFVVFQTLGQTSGQTLSGGADIVVMKLEPTMGLCRYVKQQPTFNSIVEDTRPYVKIDASSNIYVSMLTFDYISGGTTAGNLTIGLFKMFDQEDRPPCFNHGTKILCDGDKYIPVEDLKSGMLVKTYCHGYRRIEYCGKGTMNNDPSNWECCMYRLPKTNGMTDDLIITGGHSILVDNIDKDEQNKQKDHFNGKRYFIDSKYMLLASVSKSFEQIKDRCKYTYYHIVLDNENDEQTQYGIWANGVLTESQDMVAFLQQNYEVIY